MTKKRGYLYILLVTAVLFQVVMLEHTPWFPDLIVLIVVFTGVFRGGKEAVALGLVAGFLRGCFSVGTFGVDIVLFPVVGMVSSLMPRNIYRQSIPAQIFITLVAVSTVVEVQTLFLNGNSGNGLSAFYVFRTSWKHLFATVFISPIVFAFLHGLSRSDE